MAVRVITAPPGMGKTLNLTRIAIEQFKEHNKENRNKKEKKEEIFYNNIYSNYPILLKKSKKKFTYINGAGKIKLAIKDNKYYKCYSNKIKFTDMRLKFKFCDKACFFIDELQYVYDSMEYNDFPDCIAHFFQVHRHLGYKYIYTNSQSLARVIKRVLCVSEEFWNIIELKNILWWTIVDFKITYDINSGKNNENAITSNSEYYRKIFLHKKVWEGYNSEYLKELNKNLENYDKGEYESLIMTKDEILSNYMVSNKEKEELKGMTF